MTVTVRPVPKRTYQNGIRPFRPVVPSNNIRPYTLKNWRPPVPEPLPPAPLLGPKELLLLGVAVVAQLWGRLSSRPATVLPAPAVDTELLGATGVHGAGGGKIQIYYSATGRRYSGTGASAVCNNSTFSFGPDSYMGEITYLAGEGLPEPAWGTSLACGYSSLRINVGGRTNASSQLSRTTSGFSPPGVFTGWSYRLVYLNPVGAQQPASALLPAPVLPEGFVAPEVEPATVPQVPPAIPLPVPDVQPTPAPVPEVLPDLVPTTPGPKAPPKVIPASPPRYAPRAIPGTTGTNNGALVPQAPATPTTTQADAHFPVPGAGPVTGNGPRPTPEGIAQELGRIEQKLARLSNPQTDALGDATDRLSLLLQLLRQLVEYFMSINAGGAYLLSSPCVVDANDERIEYEVEYSGAPQALGVISNKIDALAQLLQVHKDLKQPNCTVKGTGQPVQVNFVQVE